MSESKEKLYQCQIDIQFPTATHALHAKEVLEVDGEIGDQVTKSFHVVAAANNDGTKDADNSIKNKNLNVLSVHIKATEAKMLRVSISSFYDMLNIFLKCHQEFS